MSFEKPRKIEGVETSPEIGEAKKRYEDLVSKSEVLDELLKTEDADPERLEKLSILIAENKASLEAASKNLQGF